MAERDDLVNNLKQLMELERGFGVEWLPLPERAAPAAPASRDPLARPAPAAAPIRGAPPAPGVAAPATGLRPPAPAPAPSRPVQAPVVAAPSPWSPPADLLTLAADAALARLASDIDACRRCGLCKERTRTVPGEGAASPELLFIGEGPGADEDRLGRPFVGAAGQLLDKMITAMGFQRGQVFIANIVKCRPPGNRTPEPAEVDACLPFLSAQIAVLKPKVLCLLGNTPLKALFGQGTDGITRMRGKRLEWQGIPTYPTFHPSYLLRNEAGKKPAWEDLKLVLKELGRTPPARG
jgi:DNA polymerase